MNTFPQTDVNSLDTKNREQLIRMATELLKGNNPGILAQLIKADFLNPAGWPPCRSMTLHPSIPDLVLDVRTGIETLLFGRLTPAGQSSTDPRESYLPQPEGWKLP